MNSAPSEFTASLIVEFDPSRVIVKAGAFPAQIRAITGGFRGGADEGGEEVDGAPEAREDGPCNLSGKQRENVRGVEREVRGAGVRDMGRENEEAEEEKQERTRSHGGILKTRSIARLKCRFSMVLEGERGGIWGRGRRKGEVWKSVVRH